MNRNKTRFFTVLELLLVCGICVFPPFFYDKVFLLPPKPAGVCQTLYFACGVLTAAFYEECLYRLYLPCRLYMVCGFFIKNLHKAAVGIEAVCVIVFAAAHFYLGFFSVLFAGFFGAFLRYSYVKLKRKIPRGAAVCITGSIHAVWNGLVYLYLWSAAGMI